MIPYNQSAKNRLGHQEPVKTVWMLMGEGILKVEQTLHGSIGAQRNPLHLTI